MKVEKEKISFVEHHISHMFNSMTLAVNNDISKDEQRAISLDGVGEAITASIYGIDIQKNQGVTQIFSSIYPNSLGLFYSAITSYLGFQINDAEFKVMGFPHMVNQHIIKSSKNSLVMINIMD